MLQRMTAEQILNIQNGETHYVRLTRLVHPKPEKIFEGRVELIVQRRANKTVCLIAVGTVLGHTFAPMPGWAEYSPDDIGNTYENGEQVPGDCLVAEDYMMEIFENEPEQKGSDPQSPQR